MCPYRNQGGHIEGPIAQRQSWRLITARFQVRILVGPLLYVVCFIYVLGVEGKATNRALPSEVWHWVPGLTLLELQ
jgi:hypothetical protein